MSTVIDNLQGIMQALWLYLLFFIVGHVLQAQACKYIIFFPLQELNKVVINTWNAQLWGWRSSSHKEKTYYIVCAAAYYKNIVILYC